MATYKQPCIHCGQMIERDSRYCLICGSRSPFGFHCPTCSQPIERGYARCPNCGRALTAICPLCGGNTFVGSERCDSCGRYLMIRCENRNCGEPQYFEITTCSACGKKIKHVQKQIEELKRGAM